jgi:hypothetical protein
MLTMDLKSKRDGAPSATDRQAALTEAHLSEFAELSFLDDEMLSDLELTQDADAPDLNGISLDYTPAGADALDFDHAAFHDVGEEPVDSAVSDEDYARYFSVPPQLEREWALDVEEHNRQLIGRTADAHRARRRDVQGAAERDIRELAGCFLSLSSGRDTARARESAQGLSVESLEGSLSVV